MSAATTDWRPHFSTTGGRAALSKRVVDLQPLPRRLSFNDRDERGAVLQAGMAETKRGTWFLVRELFLAKDSFAIDDRRGNAVQANLRHRAPAPLVGDDKPLAVLASY